MDHRTIQFGWAGVIGAIGGAFATIMGTWSIAMTILCICMAIDYASGFVVAGVFHASKKSSSGGLDSNVGWKGLARKVATLTIVLLAHFIDLMIGTDYLQNAVVIFFTVNEVVSILENCALMGVPIPKILLNGLDVLNKQSGEGDENDGGHTEVSEDD